MLDPPILDRLTEIAHTLWCRRMSMLGWQPGLFDPNSRTHDALVSYGRLSSHDRRLARVAISALDLEDQLTSAIMHERGPTREMALEEMQVGLPVAWTDAPDFGPPLRHQPADRGVIESWESRVDELILVRVRWGDGSVSEHHPCERELSRLGW